MRCPHCESTAIDFKRSRWVCLDCEKYFETSEALEGDWDENDEDNLFRYSRA